MNDIVRKTSRVFIRKSDFIILFVAFLFVASFFYWKIHHKKGSNIAQIYWHNSLIKTVNLQVGADDIFTLPQEPSVKFRLFEDASIAIIESSCKDKICIRSGRLKYAGEFTACLPNHIIVKIVANKEENFLQDSVSNHEESIDIIVK